MIDKEAAREAFTQWATSQGFDMSRLKHADTFADRGTWKAQFGWLAALEWQASLAVPQAVPEGWVLVPRVPTPEMVKAWQDVPIVVPPGTSDEDADAIVAGLSWSAMLSAAPPIPQVEPVQPDMALMEQLDQVLWTVREFAKLHHGERHNIAIAAGEALDKLRAHCRAAPKASGQPAVQAMSDERIIHHAMATWHELPAHWWEGDRNDIRSHVITFARAILSEAIQPDTGKGLIAIPKGSRKGKEPCGECHIQPGETCDLCGAFGVQPTGGEHG